MQTIAVIGGGYGGIELVRQLSKKLRGGVRICLIEGKDDFYASIGSFRALVNDEFAQQSFIPYSGLLNEDVVHVKKWVEDVDTKAKKIYFYNNNDEEDDVLEYDCLVIATGLNYKEPYRFGARTDRESEERDLLTRSVSSFRYDVFSTMEILEKLGDQRKQLAKSEKVVVIGGGATGVETACEIKQAFPKKSVEIVHSKERLMMGEPCMTPALSAKLLEKVEAMGVKVKLNTRHSGESEPETLLIHATTASPNTQYLPSDMLDDDGYVRTDSHLRVLGHDSVFALGDVVAGYAHNVKTAKMAHAPVVAKNVIALVNGSSKMAKVEALPKPVESFMVVTLGPNASFSNGMMGKIMGSTKQKDLFLSKQKKEMKAK